jgi:hypothetical protein
VQECNQVTIIITLFYSHLPLSIYRLNFDSIAAIFFLPHQYDHHHYRLLHPQIQQLGLCLIYRTLPAKVDTCDPHAPFDRFLYPLLRIVIAAILTSLSRPQLAASPFLIRPYRQLQVHLVLHC